MDQDAYSRLQSKCDKQRLELSRLNRRVVVQRTILREQRPLSPEEWKELKSRLPNEKTEDDADCLRSEMEGELAKV